MFIQFKNKKSKFFNILVVIFFLSYFKVIDNIKRTSYDKNFFEIKKFEDSHENSFLSNFFSEKKISEMKKFREINCKDILINNQHFTKSENPDVSIIITVYNQANCFFSCLRSVQNQSLKNIEIIIIDDCSLDNTTEIIDKYMIEDKRIIYLKHESNDGKIKSRSDGVRLAKGKYICIIDGDDALSHKDILYNSFTIANNSDIDVVEFRHALFQKKNYIYLYSNLENIKNLRNRIIYQPELTFKFVDFTTKDSKFGMMNRNIVSKLIKNDIFKKVLDYIGPKYTEDYLLDYEDTIMSISLFRIADSYYYMPECGYYRARGEFEESLTLSNLKKCKPNYFKINKELDPIKYLNFLLDTSKGKEIEYKLIYKEFIALNYNKRLEKRINNDFEYVYEVLNKIIQSNSYSESMKKKVIQLKNSLLKKQNKIKSKIIDN